MNAIRKLLGIASLVFGVLCIPATQNIEIQSIQNGSTILWGFIIILLVIGILFIAYKPLPKK